VLDRQLGPGLPDGRALDVGSKNGGTLPALHAALPRRWDLVELDAHRRYLTLATRRAFGESMVRGFPGCRFVAGSVTTLPGPYAVVTWFLPFVHEAPLRAWGLPPRFFAPATLLRHVVNTLTPGAVLLILNQGEAESETQGRLFTDLGLRAEALGQVDSVLSPFRRARFGWRYRAG
jgi:hypothetical protein